MKEAAFTVIYPVPSDIDEFERRYEQEHIPLSLKKLAINARFVGMRVISTIACTEAPYHRIAKVYFPSMHELENSLISSGGQETVRHAIEISTGGPPIFLITETETIDA